MNKQATYRGFEPGPHNSVPTAITTAPNIQQHNDMPWNIRQFHHNQLSSVNLSADLSKVFPWNNSNWSQTDFFRLRQGKVGAQFWVAYVPCSTQYYNAVQMTVEQIDVIKRMIEAYPEHLQLATSVKDIRDAHKKGKIAGLIGVEGGHSIGNSLSVLRMMHDLGTSYLTLTHNCNTPWAQAHFHGHNTSANRGHMMPAVGLTEFGKAVIEEMNRIGMMVDLSHASEATSRAVLKVTKAPVIFSHSAAQAICNITRNVADDVLLQIARNGGIVMVPFYPQFVSCSAAGSMFDARNGGIVMVPFYPQFVSCSAAGSMFDVIRNIDHIRNIAGIDHVGIGSDFDGIDSTVTGLEHVGKYPDLLVELLKNEKWSVNDVKKLVGGNLLRVFEKVQEVSKEIRKSTRPPAEDLIPLNELPEITNCSYNGM
ncbi:unnamed protein product [Notodromas monacha]|uniref:Dipeptidase n=1 Tax=Notodromas monacha TaxID=399045 RepID=A0A7R9GBL3_9CRUS|nr:unnamed protein product [Notodromas monacha]CAG0915173.1 unnamed protein product [Notodromas monacha]